AFIITLNPYPVLECTQIISYVQVSGRLHAGEDSCFHGSDRRESSIVSNFEVTVEKLVYGGDGLARLDGRVVFAPFVVPGGRIRGRAEQQKPGLVRARMLEVLEAAPDRVAPPCPVFGTCGGCHYQHAPYEFQLEAKRRILREELRRLGKIDPPEDIQIAAAEPFGYRNRVQLHVDEKRVGYRGARSHRLEPVRGGPGRAPALGGADEALPR